MTQFDFYGRIAEAGVEETLQNGRYLTQKDAEAFVPEDVSRKLLFASEDVVLDIGCGLGINAFPASRIVREVTCVDHGSVLSRLRAKCSGENNIVFKEGDFLELSFKEMYTKIIMYSVVPALPDMDVVRSFVDKALCLLEPKGLMLIGDIANVDKKRRFQASEQGRRFEEEWARKRADEKKTDLSQYINDNKTVVMGDDEVIALLGQIRSQGFDAYLLPQPKNLPFGYTREDILVVGPEYGNEVR